MIFRCFLVTFALLSAPILSNCFAIDAELKLLPKDANAVGALQRIVLLQDLNLKNLNQKLDYYGLPGLDIIPTEVALNEYRFSLSQTLQFVQLSRFLAPNIYNEIVLLAGPPVSAIADVFQQNNIEDINGLINELDLSIRRIFLPFKPKNALERKKRDAEKALSLQGKDADIDALWNFVLGSFKDIINNQVESLTSLLISQINTRIEGVIAEIRAWNLKGFALDISESVIGVLQLISSIIIEQLHGFQSYVANQLISIPSLN
ncbi:uncharacterized protein LOC108740842 [Agrilus planipennis]|uniref:Uncharacterized protein LOC108740842 n=1 Tax=Agrilus planipennis TaxID=224129 RepID=A0A1W4X437_AGRPL|nr:uncharacterized protein LOC108740842 [Agrilus planipennis]